MELLIGKNWCMELLGVPVIKTDSSAKQKCASGDDEGLHVYFSYLQMEAYTRLRRIRKMKTLLLFPVFGSSKKAVSINIANERQILKNCVKSDLLIINLSI